MNCSCICDWCNALIEYCVTQGEGFESREESPLATPEKPEQKTEWQVYYSPEQTWRKEDE